MTLLCQVLGRGKDGGPTGERAGSPIGNPVEFSGRGRDGEWGKARGDGNRAALILKHLLST